MRLVDLAASRGLYRSRHGLVLGVCRGLAQYFDFSVFWVRIATLITLIFTGVWPLGLLYLLAALIMKPEPEGYHDWQPGGARRRQPGEAHRQAMDNLQGTYDRLEKRLRHMEDVVTSRGFDWESRLHN